jgi:hypothetical protein
MNTDTAIDTDVVDTEMYTPTEMDTDIDMDMYVRV